jgi:hypothetical protein
VRRRYVEARRMRLARKPTQDGLPGSAWRRTRAYSHSLTHQPTYSHSLTHSRTDTLTHSLSGSLFHIHIYSLTQQPTYSLIHYHTHTFTHPLIYALTRLIHSPHPHIHSPHPHIHSPTHPLPHPLPHPQVLILVFATPLTDSLTHSHTHALTHPPTHVLTHPRIRFDIPCFMYSFTHLLTNPRTHTHSHTHVLTQRQIQGSVTAANIFDVHRENTLHSLAVMTLRGPRLASVGIAYDGVRDARGSSLIETNTSCSKVYKSLKTVIDLPTSAFLAREFLHNIFIFFIEKPVNYGRLGSVLGSYF